MEALAENWFFVLILLACIGAHFFGHGHAHGAHGHGVHRQGSGADHEQGHGWDSEPR
jgi:hypothetical protein